MTNLRRVRGFAILCGLTSVNRIVELKRVAVSQPGEGIGREALRPIMSKSFVDLSAHRLWRDVYTDNERARRTYLALGFVEEGTMRDCIWQGGPAAKQPVSIRGVAQFLALPRIESP